MYMYMYKSSYNRRNEGDKGSGPPKLGLFSFRVSLSFESMYQKQSELTRLTASQQMLILS